MSDSTYSRDIARVVEICGTLNPRGTRFKSLQTYAEETLRPETVEALNWFEGTYSLTVASYAGRVNYERRQPTTKSTINRESDKEAPQKDTMNDR